MPYIKLNPNASVFIPQHKISAEKISAAVNKILSNDSEFKKLTNDIVKQYTKIFKDVCEIRKQEKNLEQTAIENAGNILNKKNENKTEKEIDEEYEAFQELRKYKNITVNKKMKLLKKLEKIEESAKDLEKSINKFGIKVDYKKDILPKLHLTEGFQDFLITSNCKDILVNKKGNSTFKKLKIHLEYAKKRGNVINNR
jgi:hypothetical protein